MNKSIIRQIIDLETKTLFELRELYNQIMPKPASVSANKEYLKPRIAYRLQELAFGGLKEATKEQLLKIANGANTDSLKRHSDLMPGTKLCREWNGVLHEVEIAKDGFIWQGQKWKSLSAIATKITQSKWNGPKFFKLRS